MTPEQLRVQTVTFLRVENVTNFALVGDGKIDGRGEPWWVARRQSPQTFAPVLVLFKRCHRCQVDGLSLTNSPFYHMVVVESAHVRVVSLNIDSPRESKNTDGISLFGSHDILVRTTLAPSS
jgi:polygalacturonase